MLLYFGLVSFALISCGPQMLGIVRVYPDWKTRPAQSIIVRGTARCIHPCHGGESECPSELQQSLPHSLLETRHPGWLHNFCFPCPLNLQLLVQELVVASSHTDTRLVCNDGQLLHNRLTVWLLLPALRHCPAFLQEDECFVVLLPDFSVSEVRNGSKIMSHVFGHR